MRGIGKGCFRGVKYSMLADVIEYGAWKSGIRVQGLRYLLPPPARSSAPA